MINNLEGYLVYVTYHKSVDGDRNECKTFYFYLVYILRI